MRYSSALSSFELICIIVIIGILSSLGVRYLGNISQRSCIIRLKSSLEQTQSRLSSYYAKSFIAGASIDKNKARELLQNIESKNTPKLPLAGTGHTANRKNKWRATTI